jgi:outer membrane lipoprotein-sorting protein
MKMPNSFFPERSDSQPTVYAYSFNSPDYEGLLKIGYTEKNVEERIAQQFVKHPDGLKPYKIELVESSMFPDGTFFKDHDIHRILKKKNMEASVGGEWFKCTVNDVKAAIIAIKTGSENEENRTCNFTLRPEQKSAIDKTIRYYTSIKKENPERTPKFLWNAKMRFGKTFTAYKLAKEMGMKKILVLTFKPAVEDAWDEDIKNHVDFEGWQFISNKSGTYSKEDIDRQYGKADKTKPIVCFGSFQDLLGTNNAGGIKVKNEFIHENNWDLVIFDEYHYGAWRDNAKNLFQKSDEEEAYDFDIEKYKEDEADNAYNETFLPITTSYYLFLSGTPFRAINSGEFIEEQIYNWTYSDEQKCKESWQEPPENPYAALPRMVMLTYRIPDSIRQVAMQGEFNEFDLNVFFSAEGKEDKAKFIYEDEVQKWLDLIRGAHLPSNLDDMRLGQDKRPPMPFSHAPLLSTLTHTFWFLPNVASCFAMYNLLMQKNNSFYHSYNINVCAGSKAGIGLNALAPVRKSMGNPLETKTITLSCGKLTTGVTVRPWTGIFMLRNLKSPETYFQAAFRVQSPWEIDTESGEKEILKHECYVFDFALDRALKQIADYSCRLNVDEDNPEKKVADFISFLPVLAYDGSSMRQVDAQDILDIALAGTSATLLAKRWESALLVNVDNETLKRLMANEKAMNALMSIEGFRSLNKDIETIINKSEAVKNAKSKGDEKLPPKEKKELTEAEKEYKSLRKQIQEKLIKFATRIPIFMYLTDYREYKLKDVITKLEPGLFKKVTGLDVEDFELLVSLNLFNEELMNTAVFNFKRYEDSSLSYTGINKHEGKDVGGWDTVLKAKEYEEYFYNQQATIMETEVDESDMPDVAYIDAITDDKEEEIIEKPASKKKRNITTYTIPTTPAIPIPPKPSAARVVKAESQETVKVDLAKVVLNAEVYHNTFGAGKIVEIHETQIRVAFKDGEKQFGVPYVFEKGFLKFK